MFPFEYAASIASELVQILKTDCEQIEIVGSIRRLKPSVNDIDIIAIPKFIEQKDESLFGEPIKINLLDRKLSDLCLDHFLFLQSNGEKIKRFNMPIGKKTISVDLYIANESTWWTLLLIRTGSREHNIKLASRALEFQMRLKADGSGLLSRDGKLIKIQSEQEIFQYLQVPYRQPSERN